MIIVSTALQVFPKQIEAMIKAESCYRASGNQCFSVSLDAIITTIWL